LYRSYLLSNPIHLVHLGITRALNKARSHVVVSFTFSQLRSEVVVRFVDIFLSQLRKQSH